MPNSTARWQRLTTSALRSNALVGMQPQLKQTPPGRSSSTVATESPSWAQRIAATYPPGPVPTTATPNLWVAIALDEEPQRLFAQAFDVLQEPRAPRRAHHPRSAPDLPRHP